MQMKAIEKRFDNAYDFAVFMEVAVRLPSGLWNSWELDKIPKAARAVGVAQQEGFAWAEKLLMESPRAFTWKVENGDECSPDELVVTEFFGPSCIEKETVKR